MFIRSPWYRASEPYILVFCDYQGIYKFDSASTEQFLFWGQRYLIIHRLSSEVIQQGTDSFRLYIVYLLNKQLFLNPPRHFEVSSNESGLKVLL